MSTTSGSRGRWDNQRKLLDVRVQIVGAGLVSRGEGREVQVLQWVFFMVVVVGWVGGGGRRVCGFAVVGSWECGLEGMGKSERGRGEGEAGYTRSGLGWRVIT